MAKASLIGQDSGECGSECDVDFNEEWLYLLRVNNLRDSINLLKDRLVTDLNVTDDGGNTALHYCCANNLAVAVVFLLTECKANYCVYNNAGNSPLQWAIQTNSKAAAEQLLVHDYNVHKLEYELTSVSEHFSQLNKIELDSEFLLDEGTKIFYNLLDYPPNYLQDNKIQLLRKNSFGKSVLNDAFNCKDVYLLHLILEHPIAAVLEDSANYLNEADEDISEFVEKPTDSSNAIIHTFNFNGGDSEHPHKYARVKIREMEIEQNKDILNSKDAAQDLSGEIIWEAAIIAAQWFAILAKSGKFYQTSVLELGAGCGVSGISLFSNSAIFSNDVKEIMFTDLCNDTMENLLFNIELNGLNNKDSVKISRLNWHDEFTWPVSDGKLRKFDVIIGSDLIYDSTMVNPLCNVIVNLLEQKGEFFYVYKSNRDGADLLPRELEIRGLVVQVDMAAKEFFLDPLGHNNNKTAEVFFPDLECDDFMLLYATWKIGNESMT